MIARREPVPQGGRVETGRESRRARNVAGPLTFRGEDVVVGDEVVGLGVEGAHVGVDVAVADVAVWTAAARALFLREVDEAARGCLVCVAITFTVIASIPIFFDKARG